ncbi:DUF1499 domain-containing protein [Shimia abyssi]|uniref:Uncharacterized protein DUF1499 n=1 Tax=Shimia abyssi TaxID=1662395 RepID=A0A2P8FG99_9RHOB|nr:DUF1499 domain-containing protein [Shimia abyssi]PSL20738.1 uncharacterized protein DUF1499 [Shimia abyssi]
MIFVWAVLGLFIAVFAYVRLAPSDPVRWHERIAISEDAVMSNGVVRVVMIGKNGLRRFASVVTDDPRTEVLAGSVEEGMITFITRTRTVGFPDYTTIYQDGEQLKIFARSRFGRNDLGVNAARVDRWIGALRTY